MPFFSYKARDERSAEILGLVEATNAPAAARALRDRGWFVVSVAPASPSYISRISAYFSRVSFNQVVIFTRQLSTMINAGLPLTESLGILETQISSSSMRKVVSQILHQIESGSSLSQAISKYPDIFSPIYRSLVRSGEAAGKLDTVLLRLADNLEREKEFRGKVKGALVYPAIVVIGMVTLMLVMVIFIVPRLTELYAGFGSELPFATKVLVGMSNIILRYWPFGIIIAILSPILYARFKATKMGIIFLDKLFLKFPVFGPLQKKVIIVEFSRTIGILVGAGVPILDALTILGDSMESYQFQMAIRDATDRVEKGASLGDALAVNPAFPPIVPQMITIGEATGKLDDILGKLSHYFELEVDQATKTLTTSLEPLIMVVLGVGVGLLVWSVITPIYSLTSKFQ